MIAPARIQLSRRRGFDLQQHSRDLNGMAAVNVARPSKWGNPFVVHHPDGPANIRKAMTPEMAVASFRSMIEKEGGWFPVPLPWPKGKIPLQFTTIDDVKRELRGKNLACWCAPGASCHADILLELANQ